MKFFLASLLFFFSAGCSSAQINVENLKTKVVSLDFQQCLLEEKEYNQISLEAVRGFKKKKVTKHGFCEFQLWYKDTSVFYVSTDVYSGSRLNYKNRFEIGVDTYSKSRNLIPIDTIINSGEQANGNYWLEKVMGDVVVGYINASSEKKRVYDLLIKTLNRNK